MRLLKGFKKFEEIYAYAGQANFTFLRRVCVVVSLK